MFGFHTELNSKKRKQKIIRQVLSREQQNEDVVNIHRINPNNVGDFYCAPHLYFEPLQNKKLDISGFRSIKTKVTNHWVDNISANSLIIGGGGLLNLRHFKLQIELFEQLARNGKKVVIWGAGHNEVDIATYQKNKSYWVDIDAFGLVGTRDVGYAKHWVPCVSCMHPIFDNTYTETNEVGLLFNAKSEKDKELLATYGHYPQSSNTTNLEEMIAFIGSCQTIVTNSYHAMYWAILMEKKVVSIPATSKFYDFKYKTPITTFQDFESKLKEATAYTGVLEECREINRSFSNKVFDYLNL